MRVKFTDLFTEIEPGRYTTNRKIGLPGLIFDPGLHLHKDVRSGNWNFGQYIGHDLEINQLGDITQIVRIY